MNKIMMKWMIALAFSNLLVAAAQQTAPQNAQPATAPKAQPALIGPGKAASPSPPPGAPAPTQQSSIGKGALTVRTAQPVSFWQEQANTAKGLVTVDFLYDPNQGVLYGYREDDFACSNGQTEHGGIQEALYTEGNKSGKPAGSGWYAVDLSPNKCGAKTSSLYGCKFDANGDATACGTATINNSTGEIDVVAVQ